MKVGYNIVDNDALKSEEVSILPNKMSVVEFLKRVKNEQDIPLDVCVKGLDTLIANSDNPIEISRFIRELLIDKSNFLIRQNLVVQLLMLGNLQVTEDASKPKSVINNIPIELNQIFGSLKREGIHYFYTQLNLSS
jgi:hypothetical protein